jgi:hypothetical protein
MLNTDNDARIVHSFSDGEIAEMMLNTDKHEDSDDYNDNDDDRIVNTYQIPIDDIVKCVITYLLAGPGQHAFISEQAIRAVYTIKIETA